MINRRYVRSFYRHLKSNMVTKEVNQEAAGHGKERWTADLWSVELCKAWVMGLDEYRETIPLEYRENPGHNGNHALRSCKIKENLLDILMDIKEDANEIVVCEVGRGLDILIANMVKKWKRIICYDQVPQYKDYLNRFFEVEFYKQATWKFLEDNGKYIYEPCIMISHGSRFKEWDSLKNKNIVHLIENGELIW